VTRAARLAAFAALLAAVVGVAAPAAAAPAPALPPLPTVAPDLLPLKLAEIYSDFYTVPAAQVERLVRAGLTTDDVSVTCFVAVAGPSPVTTLAIQRMQRASWAEIITAIGVPARALIPVTRSSRPAPRFAALLRRLAAAPDTPPALADDEVREIVQLKVAVEYFGLEPADVAAWRGAGVAASRILLAHYFAAGGGPTGRKLQRVQGSIRVPGL
jgi:hypothetical protein